MIKLLEAPKPTKKDDVWCYFNQFWFKYARPLNKKLLRRDNILHMVSIDFSTNFSTWYSLSKIGFDISQLKEIENETMYECIKITGNKYYSAIPVAIITDNPEKYKPEHLNKYPDIYKFQNWLFTKEAFIENMEDYTEEEIKKYEFPLNSIQSAILGYGYSHGLLPSDGSHSLEDHQILLDNGDYLVIKMWKWYNK